MKAPRVIAFDGDDTLWRNEDQFSVTQDRFRNILGAHVSLDASTVDALLLKIERRNLTLYGYGVKSFVLSMIETAIELTSGAIPASDIQVLLRLGQQMLAHPIELLANVRETIERLRADDRTIWLITKGDLFDQESKIARSGLEALFDRIEIVSEKNESMYRRLLHRHRVDVSEFVMVGQYFAVGCVAGGRPWRPRGSHPLSCDLVPRNGGTGAHRRPLLRDPATYRRVDRGPTAAVIGPIESGKGGCHSNSPRLKLPPPLLSSRPNVSWTSLNWIPHL